MKVRLFFVHEEISSSLFTAKAFQLVWKRKLIVETLVCGRNQSFNISIINHNINYNGTQPYVIPAQKIGLHFFFLVCQENPENGIFSVYSLAITPMIKDAMAPSINFITIILSRYFKGSG